MGIIAPLSIWIRLRVCSLFWSSTTSMEVGIAAITLACGAQLARAESLFARFPAAYAHLASVAPEAVWACVMLMLGSAMATSMFFGTRAIRRSVLMGMVVLWWGMAGLFIAAVPGAMISGISSVVAVGCTWAFARHGLSP